LRSKAIDEKWKQGKINDVGHLPADWRRLPKRKKSSWRVGYKVHIGAGKGTGLAHHLEVTSANVHDVTMVPKLLTCEETQVYGDSGSLGAEKRRIQLPITSKAGKSGSGPIEDRLKAKADRSLTGSDQTPGA
jgi:IS5 family transposase